MKIKRPLDPRLDNDTVRLWAARLERKRGALLLKRCFDFTGALGLLLVLSPVFMILALAVKLDSKGPVFFRQQRVGANYRLFSILKFRTMVTDAERQGAQVTKKNDSRVTRVGRFIRRVRLDEIPQLVNILRGEMSFVGARPEVPRYTECYTDEMLATLLLPPGLTGKASIAFRNEDELLADCPPDRVDDVYAQRILPEKMRYNIEYLEELSVGFDIKILFQTLVSVAR